MIFIPGNVPSSKNSKVATQSGVFNSRTVARYLKEIGVRAYSHSKGVKEYQRRDNLFRKSVGSYFDGIQYPAMVGFHFVRDSRLKFDFHNACQIICDLLVAHRFIEDDNMDCLLPIPVQVNGRWYTVDKYRPGVFLEIVTKAPGAVFQAQKEATHTTV